MKFTQHPTYKDYYADLEKGEVYSTLKSNYNKEGEFKKLKPALSRGYLMFNIHFEGKRISKQVHGFVFECGSQTIPKYGKTSESLTINHINEIKIDNKFCNLELVTQRKNTQLREKDKIENKKSGLPRFVRPSPNSKKNPFIVIFRYNKKYTYFGSFSTIEEATKIAKSKFEELFKGEIY